MADRKTVPVAYVTKWAATRGIVVKRDAVKSDNFPDHIRMGHALIRPEQWTSDKAEAEVRYRKALAAKADAATKQAKRLIAAMSAPPKYEEAP